MSSKLASAQSSYYFSRFAFAALLIRWLKQIVLAIHQSWPDLAGYFSWKY